MDIVAGIDGGGTNTRAVVVNTTGKVIGCGSAGPSNYGNVSLSEVRKNIKTALFRAFGPSGQSPKTMKSIFLGMASVVGDKDRSIIRKLVESYEFIHPKHIGVDHDIRISLAGGLGGQEGIALIVGTGSSCYGRRANGRDWRAGGTCWTIGEARMI